MLTDPRYRAFGAFRFLLALTVVVSHSAWMLSGTGPGDAISGARLGSSAVLGFFVPSGFIMSEAAASFYAGRPSAFARNRGLKIFPAFGAALLLSVLVHLALFSSGLLLAGVAFEGYGSEPKDVFSTGNLLFNSASALPFISSERAREILGSGVYLFVRYIWAVKVEVAFYLTVLLFIASQSVQRVLSKHLAWALVIFSALYTWNGFTAPFCYELQFAPYFLLGIGLYLADRRAAWCWALARRCRSSMRSRSRAPGFTTLRVSPWHRCFCSACSSCVCPPWGDSG